MRAIQDKTMWRLNVTHAHSNVVPTSYSELNANDRSSHNVVILGPTAELRRVLQ